MFRSVMADEHSIGPGTELSPELKEAGRLLFAGPCEFLKGVVALDGLPATNLAEVAFAGRSNVGKSSLLNALTGRKSLARTSATPGRTREINFFELGRPEGDQVMLVDLPGYGYAKVSKSQVRAWVGLLKDYLRGRPNLRRVMLLVDSRHGLKDSDAEIMAMLDEVAVSYQIVLTKSDKPKRRELEKVLDRVANKARTHPACHPDVTATSAVKGQGIESLRAEIAAISRQ